MKLFTSAVLTLLVGFSAYARVERSCGGVGSFAKSKKLAGVKVTVEHYEDRCIVEIKMDDAAAPRGWSVACPENGNFAAQIFEPTSRDFLLNLGKINSLEVYYRSGNDFKTSYLDCE